MKGLYEAINDERCTGRPFTVLTGVTGFVGTMVLASILRQSPTTRIHVLVRDKRGVSAGARFVA